MNKAVDSKFDILKLLLSVCVLLAHVDMERRGMFPWIALIVPTYFLMTSFFLFRKVSQAQTVEEKRALFRGFVLRTVKLYLYWFVLLIPLTLYNSRSVTAGSSGSGSLVEHFLKRLFLGSTYTSSWFLTASIFGVLIMGKLSEKLPNALLVAIGAAAYIFSAGWASYQGFFPQTTAVGRVYDFYYRAMSNPHHSFPAALLWIALGKCFAEGKISLKKSVHLPVLLLSLAALWAEWRFVEQRTGFYMGEMYLAVMPAACSLFALLMNIRPFQIPGSVYIKRCSTYIYVIHGTLLPSVRYLVKGDAAVLLVDLMLCVAAYAVAQTVMNRYRNGLTALMRYSF